MITATEVTRNLKQLSDSFQGHFSIKKPGMARKWFQQPFLLTSIPAMVMIC
jgi:hypothetical protein